MHTASGLGVPAYTGGVSPGLRALAYGLIISYVSFLLSPSLYSGFYSDDLINSVLRAELELKNVTLWQHIGENTWEWLHNKGRFFPVGLALNSMVSYCFPDLFFYKMFILSMVAVNSIIFCRLIEVLTRDFFAACFAILVLPVFFQFRLYHDPILSFSGMMQLFFAFTVMSLLLFDRYLACWRRIYLALSVVLCNVVLYFYEIGLLLVLLFPILAWINNKNGDLRSIFRVCFPFIVSAAIALLVMLLARAFRDPSAAGYAGIEMNLNPQDIARALLAQLTSALPMSYYLFDPARLFMNKWWQEFGFIEVVAASIFFISYWYVIKRAVIGDGASGIIIIGAAFFILPALLISISLKYQGELVFGLGYLPVYLQYYGVASIMVVLIVIIRDHLNPPWRGIYLAVGGLAFSVVLVLTYESNKIVVDQANIAQHYRRAALKNSLEYGIVSDLRVGTIVLIKDSYAYNPQWIDVGFFDWAYGYPWKNAAMVYQYSHRRLQVLDSQDDLHNYLGTPNEIYILEIRSYPLRRRIKEGCVVLGKVENLSQDKLGRINFDTRPISEYSRYGRCLPSQSLNS